MSRSWNESILMHDSQIEVSIHVGGIVCVVQCGEIGR